MTHANKLIFDTARKMPDKSFFVLVPGQPFRGLIVVVKAALRSIPFLYFFHIFLKIFIISVEQMPERRIISMFFTYYKHRVQHEFLSITPAFFIVNSHVFQENMAYIFK